MEKQEILINVQNIFRDVFDDDALLIDESTNAESIEDWDSLNHIILVSSIEKAFKIKFALGELLDLQNVGEMIVLMMEKLSHE